MQPTDHRPGPLIAVGRTAEVYAWNQGQALKLFYDWCPDNWAKHEVDIGHAMNATGLPIPELLGEVEVNGRSGILYERVEGTSMLRMITSKPWLIPRMARLLAGLQAEIHYQDGSAFPSLRGYLEASIQGAKGLAPEQKAQTLERLGQLPDGESLCHFDFHPDQVLITAEGPVVLDWMTAQKGNPMADIARTSLLLAIGSAQGRTARQAAFINVVRGWFHDNYLERALELHPGATRAQIEAWKLPVAAARLVEGIWGEQAWLLGYIQTRLQGGDA